MSAAALACGPGPCGEVGRHRRRQHHHSRDVLPPISCLQAAGGIHGPVQEAQDQDAPAGARIDQAHQVTDHEGEANQDSPRKGNIRPGGRREPALGKCLGQMDQCEEKGGQQRARQHAPPLHQLPLDHSRPGQFLPDIAQHGADDHCLQKIETGRGRPAAARLPEGPGHDGGQQGQERKGKQRNDVPASADAPADHAAEQASDTGAALRGSRDEYGRSEQDQQFHQQPGRHVPQQQNG